MSDLEENQQAAMQKPVAREHKEQHALRLLFMILFWFILRLSYVVTGLLALLQWVWLWFAEPSTRVRRFAVSLGQYQQQTLDYVLFNHNEKPFPFADWPSTRAPSDALNDVD